MRKAFGGAGALAVGLLVGCSGERSAPADALQRDLTLQTKAATVLEVASPVELGRPEPRQRTAPRRTASPKPAPAPTPKAAPAAAPTAEPVSVPQPVASAEAPAPAAMTPAANGRELSPGQTVTVLPASSVGSSQGPDDLFFPVGPGRGIKGGGGHCPTPPSRGGRPRGIVGFR